MIRLVASLSLTPLLVVAGRRTLYFLSGLATILSLAAFSTVLLLSDSLTHRQLLIIDNTKNSWDLELKYFLPIFPITGCRSSQSLLTWLALVSASCLVFSVTLGLQPMPLLLSSELYPPDLRAACKVFTTHY